MKLLQTRKAFGEAVVEKLGRGRRHALQLYSSWMRTGKPDVAASWIEPQARHLVEQIVNAATIASYELVKVIEEGDAIKFLIRFPDGCESESVLLRMQAGNTLCVSSQVGCRMGCRFCETGKMGLIRQLSSEEIVLQLFVARHHLRCSVRNIVFMGMGEPFDNYDAVMDAVRVMTDGGGLAIAPRHITVSTSGVVDAIRRLALEPLPVRLAVSVNAPSDDVRRRIMPVNRRWKMDALKQAMIDYCGGRREILIEYVLLADLNDSEEAADLLAVYLEGLQVRVNLIPYNAQTSALFSPPAIYRQERFATRLRSQGYQVLLRGTKGERIMAACGQLGNRSQRGEELCQIR